MQIGVLVTSHRDYAVPLERCIRTLSCFERRLIVIGGHSQQRLTIAHETPCIEADHNSHDFTGLIEILKNPVIVGGWTHVLCVQDTMEAGVMTADLCKLAHETADATAAFGGQSYLVLYRLEYLRQMADFIHSQMNCTKNDVIRNECALWKMAPVHHEFPAAVCVTVGEGRPFSDVPRIKEYYFALQIVKWKANYGQNMDSLIVSP